MSQQTPNPFADRRGLLAIVIIGVFFIFWQWYMGQKYPTKSPVKREQGTSFTGDDAKTETAPAVEGNDVKTSTLAPEKLFQYDGAKVSFVISSNGMGFKEFTLKDYTDREHKPVRMSTSDEHTLFEMRLGAQKQLVPFNVTEKGPGHFVGTALINGVTITREIAYDETKQSFENTIDLKNGKPENLEILIPEKIRASKSRSFLFPSYDHQDFFVNHEDKTDTINFSSSKEDIIRGFKNVRVAAISSQYFTSTILDHSDVTPELDLRSDLKKSEALAALSYQPAAVTAGSTLHFAQTFFVGPKSIEILEGINPELTQVINLGMLSILAKPMLLLMKGFETLVHNWGLAIILLTLVVRLVVFPLYMMSTKSMKAMQKVQPQIKDLREKYKDDAMTMNREMMALMKENKANPIGGCLPMLLQIPIFFALYRVISSSVELYQAPFFGWIQDLSLHDPFFVLPVLLGITMFVQQKMTPTTMDPAQAKVMAFMPVIFSVFMLYLPSGLTLYMFVSALFGFTQQYIIMKDTRAKATK